MRPVSVTAGPCWLRRVASRWPHHALVVLAVLVGCGGPPRAEVRGTATLDGQPLTAGRIVFDGDGRSYTGVLGPDGRYELQGGAAGVAPGTYTIVVLPPEPEFVAQPNSTDMRQVNPPDPRLYPERFRSAATSGISRTVPAGESTIDVELSSK